MKRLAVALVLLTSVSASRVCFGTPAESPVEKWLASAQASASVNGLSDPPGAEVLSDPESVRRLVAASKHELPRLRHSIVSALGDSTAAPEQVVPALVARFSDPDPSVRVQAALAAAKLGDLAVPSLVQALHNETNVEPTMSIGPHGHTSLRIADLAAYALSESKGDVLTSLVSDVRNSRKGDANLISNKLIAAGNEEPFPRIGRIFNSEGSIADKTTYILGANIYVPWPAVAALLDDESNEIREIALRVLKEKEWKSEELTATLERIAVVPGATSELAKEVLSLRQGSSVQAFIRLIGIEPEPSVRARMLMQVCRRLNTPEILKFLQENSSDVVRARAAYCIADRELANAEVIAGLTRALTKESPAVRENSAYALRVLSQHGTRLNDAALSALIQTVTEGDGRARVEAAGAIGGMGKAGARASPFLMEALRKVRSASPVNMDWDSRRSLLYAIREIGTLSPADKKDLEATLPTERSIENKIELSEVLVAVGADRRNIAAGLTSAARQPWKSDSTQIFDHETYHRRRAFRLAAEIWPAEVIRVVEDPSAQSQVRQTACEGLVTGSALPPQSVAMFAKLFKTNDLLNKCAALGLLRSGSSSRDVLVVISQSVLTTKEDELGDQIAKSASAASTLTMPVVAEKIADAGWPSHWKLLRYLADSVNAHSEVAPLALRLLREIRSRAQPDMQDDVLRTLADIDLTKHASEVLPVVREGLSAPKPRAALEVVAKLKDAASPLLPDVTRLLEAPDELVRIKALESIATMGSAAGPARLRVEASLLDESRWVRARAATALLILEPDITKVGPQLNGVVIDHYYWVDSSEFFDAYSFKVRAPMLIFLSARSRVLPEFPWPPPSYAHIATGDRDFPRALLGAEDATLGDVNTRVTRALVAIDPDFESSLFSVPGGFALLARIERIMSDGQPVAGNRWVQTKIPPRTFSDYVATLFHEQKGYFRSFAFVFTTDSDLGPGPGILPSIHSGGRILPSDIAAKHFRDVDCHILVYAFERDASGRTKTFDSLSARTHLLKSGVFGTSIAAP